MSPTLDVDIDVPTPEALADAAGQRGLQVRYEQRRIEGLRPADCPCIVLDRAGRSRILLARQGAYFETLAGGVPERVTVADVAKEASGTVFFVRPSGPSVPGGSAEAPGTAKARGLFAEVLMQMLRGQTKLFAQLCATAAIGNTLVLALPIFSMVVYDRVVPHLAFETLWALTLGVLLALGFDMAIRLVRQQLADAMAVKGAVALQTRLFARLVRAPLDKAPRDPALVGMWMRELDTLCQTIPTVVVCVLVDLPFIILVTILLAYLGGPVALVPLACALLLATVFVAAHALSTEANREAVRLSRAQTTMITEVSAALESVKAATAEAQLLSRWERLADAAAYAGHQSRQWGQVSAQAVNTISLLAVVLVMVVGVHVIAAGAMTLGALTAATMLIGRVMQPVAMVVGSLHRARLTLKLAEGLGPMLAQPLETSGDAGAAARPIRGALELRNVTLTYPSAPAPALRHVSLAIRPGEKVAIIGRVGCGKSSLLRLLVRLLEPTSGSVLLDDGDIRQVSPTALRRAISLMRQDHVLLDDTLRANVCLGLEQVPEDQFEQAVTVSGVREFAARNPHGYSQGVGPRGERLSGGERQMVALARALVVSPAVLILDEPTAAMDNSLEAKIVRDLATYAKDRTLIIATHRAQALALVDRIVWLDDGVVIADGPKEEVLKKLNGQQTKFS